MRRLDYEKMRDTQASHWWYEGKRRVINSVIKKKVFLPKNSQILEIGSGTGANLSVLSKYGNVAAMELDDYARKAIRENSRVTKLKGYLPDGLGEINGKTFDMICMFDVLEHIEDDGAALEALKPNLKADGKLFITVPAYQWMFGVHDVNNGHYRRYNRKGLVDILITHGFKVIYSGYMNTLMFPLMTLARILNLTGTNIPRFGLNEIFKAIYSFEALVIPGISMPFGGSVIAVCVI